MIVPRNEMQSCVWGNSCEVASDKELTVHGILEKSKAKDA
jgi:hypothetical protein